MHVAKNNQVYPITRKYQCHLNKLFVTSVEQNHDNGFPLYILMVKIEQ